MKKTYKSIIKVLQELSLDHPSFSMGRHIATATSEYGDIWNISDAELLFALNKYSEELSLNISTQAEDKYLEEIISDGLDLEHILDEEDEF